MAKLNQPIQIQKFELIRNRIADILIDEITNQITLQYSDLFIIGVFIERFPTFDKTELPVINVSLARGSYDNEDVIQSDGTYTYYVDAFMRFSSVQNQDGSITDGSSLAAIKVQRAIAFCRTVLKNQAYRTLGFAPPFLNNITVSEFNIANPDREDMEHTIMARITVTVVAPETSELASARLLEGYDTQVLLGDSALGYVFSGTGSIIPPPPPGSVNLVVNGAFFKELITSPYLLAIQNSQGLAVGLLDPANNLVIVPDSVAEINGIEVLTIPSGATSEIKVLQNGVEVGSLIGGDWVVPVCADGAVTITDSDGATLYVVNVTSGGAETQAIGDSSVEVRNSLNAIVDSGVVKAQGSGVFNAPDATFSINSVAVRTAPSDGSASIQVRRNSGSVQVGSLQGQHWRVGNSTVNVRKSDGALISARTVAAEDTENYNVTDSVIENSDASYTANVKATEGLILPDINIEVNTVVEGTIPAIKDVKILITDGVNPVTPDDVSVVGDTVTVEVSAAPAPPPSGDFVVRFFDIDGTILKEQFVDAGNDATAPTNPDFDPTYLTFAEWNQPFTNVQNDIDVGAIYDTIDGKTYLFVRITDTTGLTPSIRLQKPNTTLLTVDWGDSTTSTSSASGSVTLTKAANYAAIGDYVITIDSAATYSNVRNINYMNNDATYQEIVLRIYMGHNARVDRQFGLNMRFLSRFSVNKEYTNGITDTSHTRQLIVNCANIPHINIPKPEIDMEAVVFASGARSLRTISIPNNFFSTGNMFNGTTSLESVIMLANDIDNNCFNTSAVDKVILNNSVTIIGISAFRNANRLRVLKIPNSLITLSQDALRDMDSISVLEFPDTLTTVGGNAMAGMGSMLEFVFLSTTPPTIVSTSFAGTTLRPITKIYVPDANVAAYKVATNWSAIASYIYPLSTRP